jgi:hypothetical protein
MPIAIYGWDGSWVSDVAGITVRIDVRNRRARNRRTFEIEFSQRFVGEAATL